MRLRLIITVITFVLIAGLCWWVCRGRLQLTKTDEPQIQQKLDKGPLQINDASHRPIVVHEDGYIGSDACRECHPQNHESWHASYHRTMTQLATPETVVGSFDNVERHYVGESFRLERRGDEFWIETDVQGPDGQMRPTSRRIVMTTGSHHFQAYWAAGEPGRAVDLVPATYRIDEGRWIPTYEVDPMRWTTKGLL